ncbi:uncharacterized protein [Apostichopus japonicus]|uniref:uncharacterized protein isoform X2 n=1 Tax=Stichopus japonicus TaxID=307972 RepID=UPI003AB473C5
MLHEVFEENEIDKEALFLLGEEDVRAWIPKTGPRLKFLKRLADLKVGADLEKFKEERHTECRNHSVTWQPQVVVIGTSVLDVQQVFVFLNNIVYSVPSVVKGIDVCFKTFQVFNIEYPLECKSLWTFLQRGIYNIETQYDSVTPRVRELLSILRPDSD